ncbi:hypothetical protein VTN00DRAFT_2640 [Thermoascus crustaceus]|uniref:uncharacterized protein n=1 Tax=Thermoascus crustaceus TaxID=5088 RepID=UPI003743950C
MLPRYHTFGRWVKVYGLNTRRLTINTVTSHAMLGRHVDEELGVSSVFPGDTRGTTAAAEGGVEVSRDGEGGGDGRSHWPGYHAKDIKDEQTGPQLPAGRGDGSERAQRGERRRRGAGRNWAESWLTGAAWGYDDAKRSSSVRARTGASSAAAVPDRAPARAKKSTVRLLLALPSPFSDPRVFQKHPALSILS